VWNALELASLGLRFDTVLDCGLFHVFEDDDRRRFVGSLDAVITEGGMYHVLCFCDRQPGTLGPRRVTQAEIRDSFSGSWRVDSIVATTIEILTNPKGARAWRAGVTRL
jgi:hypothetical protein